MESKQCVTAGGTSAGDYVSSYPCGGTSGHAQVWKWFNADATNAAAGRLQLVTADSTSPALCLDDGSDASESSPAVGQVWARPLHVPTGTTGTRLAVLLFNPHDSGTAKITATWLQLGLEPTAKATVRDLWQHKDLGQMTGNFSASVAPHGGVMVTIATAA